MEENNHQPKEYDRVLGGNNPPLKALVLGGIDGIKSRFANTKLDDKKIIILREALQYGEAGEEFLSDIFSVSKGKIQWMAAALISATNNQVYKEVLVDYFAELIFYNSNDWNNWRKEIPEIKLYLQGLKFDYSDNCSSYDTRSISYLEGIGIDLSNINFMNSDLNYFYFKCCNFNNTNFSQANLSYSYLHQSEFKQTKFIEANLEGANFKYSQLIEVDFKKVNLRGVSFESASLKKIKFENINFENESGIYDKKCLSQIQSVQYANFQDSILEEVVFENCNLKNAYFVYLDRVTFNNCTLTNTKFDTMKNILFKDSNLDNSNFMMCNLSGVTFKKVSLKGADFRWCDLKGVDFAGLDVRGANFTRSTFDNNSLQRANTQGAKFSSINKPTRNHDNPFPLFPKKIINPDKLKGALFSNEYYYEAGAE